MDVEWNKTGESSIPLGNMQQETEVDTIKQKRIWNFWGVHFSFLSYVKQTYTAKETVAELEDFDLCVVVRTVHDSCKTENFIPTFRDVRKEWVRSIGSIGGRTSLRTILRNLRDRRRGTKTNRQILYLASCCFVYSARHQPQASRNTS
jgi:hypothetical protein